MGSTLSLWCDDEVDLIHDHEEEINLIHGLDDNVNHCHGYKNEVDLVHRPISKVDLLQIQMLWMMFQLLLDLCYILKL